MELIGAVGTDRVRKYFGGKTFRIEELEMKEEGKKRVKICLEEEHIGIEEVKETSPF